MSDWKKERVRGEERKKRARWAKMCFLKDEDCIPWS